MQPPPLELTSWKYDTRLEGLEQTYLHEYIRNTLGTHRLYFENSIHIVQNCAFF